ncbi:MAG: hypothetical protein UW94_C0004G0060 [Parcubacteria group bacterium GW2011_GWA2_45_14]|nr:MAG: hypothetical protein UW94_C0004G0060 [Parcubacteria group bacterium GW2011_GWA2_45_14]
MTSPLVYVLLIVMPQIQISIPVSIFKEDKVFVAYTPALDVSTCADTLAEVKKRFAELVGIFFEELERKGTINEVLESMGWKKVKSSWSAPVEVEHSIESFEVPARS